MCEQQFQRSLLIQKISFCGAVTPFAISLSWNERMQSTQRAMPMNLIWSHCRCRQNCHHLVRNPGPRIHKARKQKIGPYCKGLSEFGLVYHNRSTWHRSQGQFRECRSPWKDWMDRFHHDILNKPDRLPWGLVNMIGKYECEERSDVLVLQGFQIMKLLTHLYRLGNWLELAQWGLVLRHRNKFHENHRWCHRSRRSLVVPLTLSPMPVWRMSFPVNLCCSADASGPLHHLRIVHNTLRWMQTAPPTIIETARRLPLQGRDIHFVRASSSCLLCCDEVPL